MELNNNDDLEKLPDSEIENDDKKLEFKNKIMKEVIEWALVILISISAAYVINKFIIVNADVPTGSMENTIMTNDRVVASRLSYLIGEPERYDIIVFIPPDEREKLYVKRVIGLPGETVELIDGKVYIDGREEPLNDSFTREESFDNKGPYHVPENSYFVLGDNRNYSHDSRGWENSSYVPIEDVLGKVIFRYFPRPRIYSKNQIQ